MPIAWQRWSPVSVFFGGDPAVAGSGLLVLFVCVCVGTCMDPSPLLWLHTLLQASDAVLVTMTVDIDGSNTQEIQIRRHDNPRTLAEAFLQGIGVSADTTVADGQSLGDYLEQEIGACWHPGQHLSMCTLSRYAAVHGGMWWAPPGGRVWGPPWLGRLRCFGVGWWLCGRWLSVGG